MKMLKKLALVSAVSMISAGSFAMEAMDDETMSATTGQDGITILVKPGVLSATEVTNLGVTTTTQDMIDNPTASYYANNDNSFNGLSIKQVVIHDNDGWTNGTNSFGNGFGGTAGTTDNSGALVIGDGTAADSTVVIADGTKGIVIDIDMVGDAGASDKAMLNIRINTPRLGIKVGSIGIADSYNKGTDGVDDSSAIAIGTALAATDADNSGTTDGNAYRGRVTIMNGMEIVMGAATTNIQLGGESQGAMIVLDTSLIGGLAINNFALNDTAGVCNASTCTAPTALGDVITGGGSLAVGSLVMTDAGGQNLTVKAKIDVGSVSTTAYTAAETTTIKDNLAVVAGATDYASANAAQKAAIDAKFTGVQSGAQGAYNGLVVQLTQVGHSTNGMDLTLNNVGIGTDTDTATAGWQGKHIGDVQMLGLNINGTTLVISGH